MLNYTVGPTNKLEFVLQLQKQLRVAFASTAHSLCLKLKHTDTKITLPSPSPPSPPHPSPSQGSHIHRPFPLSHTFLRNTARHTHLHHSLTQNLSNHKRLFCFQASVFGSMDLKDEVQRVRFWVNQASFNAWRELGNVIDRRVLRYYSGEEDGLYMRKASSRDIVKKSITGV